MSESTPQGSNSRKTRLGRGLGSLLGAANEASGAPSVESSLNALTPASTPNSPPAPIGPVGSFVAASVLAPSPAPESGAGALTPLVVQAVPTVTAGLIGMNGTTNDSAALSPPAFVPPPMQAGTTLDPKFDPRIGVTQTAATSNSDQDSRIIEESQIWKIPVDRLKPNDQQPRQVFSPEALRDLSASIKEKGILQPIVARRLGERSFQIIAGERRWRAAQMAGLHEVPVILKKVAEQDSLELAIIENIQRENLNPLEEAEAYDRLMSDYHLTQQMVADKVGKERATVANALRLLMLPREVKDLVKKGELTAGHAKAILGIENPIDQVAIAKRTVADRLSVRATEKLVARARQDGTEATASKPESSGRPEVTKRLVDGLASELQRLLGTKVSIEYASGKGKLNIHYYSDDELTSLVDKIRAACSK